MQRHVSALHAQRVASGERIAVEVESRGRRSDGAGLASVDGLIAGRIVRFCGAFDVGRQRHGAVALEEGQRLYAELELEQIVMTSDEARFCAARQRNRRLRTQRFARVHVREDAPIAQGALEQNLHLPARRFHSEYASRNHPCVVQHEQIAGRQQRWKIPKTQIP